MERSERTEDRYIVYTNDVKPRIGFSIVDEFQYTPRSSLSRIFSTMQGEDRSSTMLLKKRDPLQLLCQGAAAGLDKTDTIRHLNPNDEFQGFMGFIEKNHDGDLVSVRTRGVVVLTITDAENMALQYPVFASGPNTFSSIETPGSHKIGFLLFKEGLSPARYGVCFYRFDYRAPGRIFNDSLGQFFRPLPSREMNMSQVKVGEHNKEEQKELANRRLREIEQKNENRPRMAAMAGYLNREQLRLEEAERIAAEQKG
jgi:hypothetical protein